MFEIHFKIFANFLVTFATGSGFIATKDTTSQDEYTLLLHSVKRCGCPNNRKQLLNCHIILLFDFIYIFFRFNS